MKKITIQSIALAAFILGLAFNSQPALAHEGEDHTATTTTTATTTNGYTVMVMKHLCNNNIKNMDDFRALENGREPVAALANTVLNCPTTGLPEDIAVAETVASPRTTYDFHIKGEHYGNMSLSNDGHFTQHKLSEADINVDVDGNGTIASSTALDISHYEFPNVMADNGRVEVTETTPPAGFKFGTIRFTPPVIDGNNDKQALLGIDEAQGRIQLDMTHDTDHMIMLHVYNFRTDTSGNTNDRLAIINQINALQQQIANLLSQIQNLLNQLK